jgi:hypothetical protein
VGGCGAAPPGEKPAAEQKAPVVYGNDDRREAFELDDPALKELAQRTAVAIMTEEALQALNDPARVEALRLGNRAGLCAEERFAEQPAPAQCSGTLMGSNLVLTAGHCVRRMGCEEMRLVLGFYYTALGTLREVRGEDVYRCSRVLVVEHSESGAPERVDYAWLVLDRPVPDPTLPIEFRPREEVLNRGELLTLIGFGAGIPLKIDIGAQVVDARARTLDYFIATSDTFHGSSGSGVFDRYSRFVGIHNRGAPDYVARDSTCQTVAQREPEFAEEQATYGFRALEAVCNADGGGCCSALGECGVTRFEPSGCGVARPQVGSARGFAASPWVSWLSCGAPLLLLLSRRRPSAAMSPVRATCDPCAHVPRQGSHVQRAASMAMLGI